MPAADQLSPAARAAVLDVLVFVSWADGRLSAVELAAVRGAAAALALLDPLDPARGVLALAPGGLDDIKLSLLTRRERHLVLAAAAWMVLVDAKRTPREARTLDDVARQTGLDDKATELLFDVARWVRQVRPRTGSTWAEEFEQLVRVTDVPLGTTHPGAPRAIEGAAYRPGPGSTVREKGARRRVAPGWRALLGVALVTTASACGPRAHYGLANAPSITRDTHADDWARDAVANGPEACPTDRLTRDRRGRERDHDRTVHPACADRGLLGIPARGSVPRR